MQSQACDTCQPSSSPPMVDGCGRCLSAAGGAAPCGNITVEATTVESSALGGILPTSSRTGADVPTTSSSTASAKIPDQHPDPVSGARLSQSYAPGPPALTQRRTTEPMPRTDPMKPAAPRTCCMGGIRPACSMLLTATPPAPIAAPIAADAIIERNPMMMLMTEPS